jgi:uncharacterized membrane protein
MKNESKTKKRVQYQPRFKQILVWIITVVLSTAYVVVGHGIFSDGLDIFNTEGALVEKGRVQEIGETVSEQYDLSEEITYENSATYFTVSLTTGPEKGTVVTAVQTSDNYTDVHEEPVSAGDKVILYNYGEESMGSEWIFGGYARFDTLLLLGILFFVLLLVFGRMKGFNTIVSLTFTVLAIFTVFIPSILSGYNIYLMSLVTCIFTIAMTLLITNGASTKSIATILGCIFGVAVAAGLSIVFEKLLRLTGMLDEHSIYLTYLDSGVSIDLVALIYAMIVIGAMGAVMDVAMDISSSLYEIRLHARDIGFARLVKSGIRIGRDVMGTMANTLVLAYIGSSLASILLLITYSASLRELLNRESIVVEILQALVGSTAILLTIPLTAVVCGIIYTQKPMPDTPAPKTSHRTEEEMKPISAMTEEERQAYFFGD